MSQVVFNTTYRGKPAEVVSGWDSPFNTYHLTVFDPDPEAEFDTLWDDFPIAGQLIDDVSNCLRGLQIEPPPGFTALCMRKEMNVVHRWNGESWS